MIEKLEIQLKEFNIAYSLKWRRNLFIFIEFQKLEQFNWLNSPVNEHPSSFLIK